MSTQEADVQVKPPSQTFDLDFMSFLEEKGIIKSESPDPSAVPGTIKQDLRNDFLHFIKGKGYSLLEEPLPSREEAASRLTQSTEELRQLYLKKFGATIGPVSREKIYESPTVSVSAAAAMQGPRAETIGPLRPTDEVIPLSALAELKNQAEKSFLEQAGDVMALLNKSTRPKTGFLPVDVTMSLLENKEVGQFFVDTAAHAVTAGIVKPELLDKLDQLYIKAGLSPKDYQTIKQRRENLIKEIGYTPEKLRTPISLVYQLLPLSKILKVAGGIGASAKVAPIVQKLITAVFAGGVTGTAQVVGEKLAGEPFDLEKDLPKIPTHMLYWSLFEMGVLGAQTAAKIVNWNLKYGGKPFGTGKRGGYGAAQGIEFETQYAPGRGPTTRAEFTVDEIKDIYRRGDLKYSGARKIPGDPSNWERQVYEAIGGAQGWSEGLKRGWVPPRPVEIPGETPVVTGRRVRPTGTVPPYSETLSGENIRRTWEGQEIGRENVFTRTDVPLKPEFWDVLRSTPRQYPAPGMTGTPPSTFRPEPEVPAAGAIPVPGIGPGPTPPPGMGGAPRAAPGATGAPPSPKPKGPPSTDRIGLERERSEILERLRADDEAPIPPWVTRAEDIESAKREYRRNHQLQKDIQDSVRAAREGRPWTPDKTPTRYSDQNRMAEIDRIMAEARSRKGPVPPPPAEKPPITTPPPPTAGGPTKPRIKVTPQPDGSFTIETETPPVVAPPPRPVGEKAGPPITEDANWRDENVDLETRKDRAIRRTTQIDKELELGTDAAKAGDTGEIQYQIELNKEIDEINNFLEGRPTTPPAAKTQVPRTQTALRDAIDRIQADQGTPEDVRLVAQAARRSERLSKVVEGLKSKQRTDLLTGVGSDRALAKQVGWEKKPVVLFDLAGVKAANNDPARGYKWADENIFKPAGSVFRAFGDDRIYRRSGTADEFPLVGKPGQTLQDLTKDAELISQELSKSGIEHRFSTGRNFSDAEKRMAGAKKTSAIGKPSPVPRKAKEIPEDHSRRIFKSRREAQAKRGRVGVPKNSPRIVWDILDVTNDKGIRPIKTSTGKTAEEYRSIPKYLKNKDGMAIDEVETILETEKGYAYGMGATKSLLDDLQDLYFQEGHVRPKAQERDADEWEEVAKEYQDKIDARTKTAEEAGVKTKEENYKDFMERMTSEAQDSGLGEDEAWTYVEAKIQAQRAYEDKYKPVMNEGETWPKFLKRMEGEAVNAGMFPEESLVYADKLLKKKVGSSEPTGGERLFVSPRIKDTGAEKGSAWYSGLKDPKGRPFGVVDPEPRIVSPIGGEVGETYSNTLGRLEYEEKSVRDMAEWRITLDHWMRGDDPNFNDFLDTIKRIFAETGGYGKGIERNVPYIPPIAMKVAVEKNFRGHKGARMFQLKWLLAHDFVARLFQVPAGNPPFYGTHAFLMGFFKPPHPLAHRTVGAFIRPQTGELFINPNYLDARALGTPWRAAMHIRDIVLHEFTHYWVPNHEHESFSVQVKELGTRTDHLMPYVLQVAEKITGKVATIDKRKTFISLGPGRGAEVSNQIINLAGNEAARMVAEAKEQTGGKIYEPKSITARKAGGERGGKGGGEPGEHGPAGDARAGRQPELPGARSDAQARQAGLGVRPGGVEWKPPVQGEPAPGEEFKLAPTEEAPPPFKPEGLEGKQGVLPIEGGGDLFKKKPDERFIFLVKANQTRPPRPQPRPLPVQPRIPDTGIWSALRTDDGGIYFGTEPNHYLLAEKLGIPKERIVGGGFIKDGDYIESPWSEAGRIGRDAREEIGMPRELYSITGKAAESVMPEIMRLTTGKFFPKEWMGNTRQEIEDNRQNLARFILENYKPEMGPLENYINRNKRFFYRGGRTRNVAGPAREEQFVAGAPELPEAASVFEPESQPKNKPQPEPEIPGETLKKNLFGSEEIRALNTIRKAGQAYARQIGAAGATEDTIVDVLKSRILQDPPESYSSLADRLNISRKTAQNYFNNALELMRNDPQMIELMNSKLKQMNIGPLPSEEDLRRMAKMLRKYFSSYRGADKIIDQQNDQRIGGKMAEIFQQTLDSGVLNKWLDEQPAGVNDYVNELVQGRISGDGYQDIANSMLPTNIKTILTNIRRRIDRLSELIVLHGGLTPDTKAAFNNNLGKYLTKSYRLWEDKHWDPSPADRDGFKRLLMNQYGLTDPQAEDFIEAELAYARNDEGLRPRRSRRTRRVPTDNYIRRRDLSPEWRKFAGEIDRVPWLLLNTVTKQATMAYNAKFLDWISDYLPDHWVNTFEEAAKRGWQNSRFPEHSYAHGKLSGKWVDPELYQYIKSEFDMARSDTEEAIQKFIMNPFKWTKTIGSLPSHSRNFLSNFGFSMLLRNSILNPLNAKWYIKSGNIHLNKTGSARDVWKTLIEEGVTETQFYGAEIPRMHKDVMRFDPATWPEKIRDKFVAWPIDKLGELYNFGDSLYRVSSHLKNTAPRSEGGFGMTPGKSVEEINAGLQNYRKLPVAVDFLRRWPVLGPFISFKANTVKIIFNQARMAIEEIKSPATRSRGIARWLRLALFWSIPMILSEVSKKIFDVDEKQIKELERWYPEYRRNGTFIYFRGEDDKLKVFDLSFLWPTGDIERFGRSILRGDVAGAKDSLDFFSHPLLDVWSILIKGQDPQWGAKYRTIFDRAKAAAAYLYLPASMPIPNLEGLLHGDVRPGNLTGPQIKAVIDAYNGQPDQYGRIKQLPEEIKNFFTGIRTWDVEPEKLLAQAAVVRVGKIRELQGELSSWIRKNTKAPQWEIENHTKRFKDQIAGISAELQDIKRLGDELKKTGFKATRY